MSTRKAGAVAERVLTTPRWKWQVATLLRGPASLRIAGSCWPVDGLPLVTFEHREVASVEALAAFPIDVAIVDATSDAELRAIAELRARQPFALVARLAPGLDETALRCETHGLRELRTIPLDAADPYLLGRVAEAVVRRRVYRQLIEELRTAVEVDRRALAAVPDLADFDLPGAREPAPLETIEHEHVAGAIGLWGPVPPKLAETLELSPPTYRRHRRRWPAAIEAALAEPSLAPPLRILCVEPHAFDPGSMRDVVRAWARRRGREVDLRVAATAERARHLVAQQPPEVVWVDAHLEQDGGGVPLVEWLRERRVRAVVLGQSVGGSAVHLQRLAQLDVLGVWTGRSMAGFSGLDDALDTAAWWIDRRRKAERALHAIELLEADLHSPRPEGLGDASVSLRRLAPAPSSTARSSRRRP